MGHSLLLLWGPESQGDFIRWVRTEDSEAFVALHGAFALIGFMLRQFELARLIGIRPYNAIAFRVLLPYLLVYFSSTLSDNPVGSLRRGLWRGSDLSLPTVPTRIPQLDTQPFHMMGVAGILGEHCSAIHGVTVETHCIKMENKLTLSRRSIPRGRKKRTVWLLLIVSGLRFWNCF